MTVPGLGTELISLKFDFVTYKLTKAEGIQFLPEIRNYSFKGNKGGSNQQNRRLNLKEVVQNQIFKQLAHSSYIIEVPVGELESNGLLRFPYHSRTTWRVWALV